MAPLETSKLPGRKNNVPVMVDALVTVELEKVRYTLYIVSFLIFIKKEEEKKI